MGSLKQTQKITEESPACGGQPGAEKLAQILNMLPHLSPTDRSLIERAYQKTDELHYGIRRASGQPYVMHPLAVAFILAEMQLDAPTIAAALLHDTVEDTDYKIQNVEEDFNLEVARLVHGVTKMSAVTSDEVQSKQYRSKADREAEFLKHIFMAMGNDVRVILIKLADRLDNMRTLGYLSEQSQLRNARETLEIFAPMANRLGIGHLKWQLEDLAFRYLEPDTYKDIANRLAERRVDREDNVDKILDKLVKAIDDADIKAQVRGRPKHIYSIWRKMRRKEVAFEQIFDVRALRVLVDDIPTCYQVLGLVHGMWKPVHGEFDDYIAAPKPNGYQSLHTAVWGDDGRPLEIQIRTHEMDQDAEYGIAAHWKYKESGRNKKWFEDRVGYLRNLLDRVSDDNEDAAEFVEDIRESIADERVYVISPKGDIYDLPVGSTPIDFAYHVHTEVGHRCRGAKVNGRMVGLDYKLQNGDHVEIITANRGGPSLDWMNPSLGYAKTHRARQKIRQWFRRRNRENNINTGRETLDKELKRMGIEQIYTREQIADITGYSSVDHMLEMIGLGNTTANNIVSRLIQLENERRSDVFTEDDLIPVETSVPRGNEEIGVNIDGASGMLVSLANCCHPAPPDQIKGFVTRGSGIKIHRQDCKNILNTNEPERLMAASWSIPDQQTTYVVPVEIRAHDREGLMRDIGAVIAAEHVSMTDVNIKTAGYIAIFELSMKVADVEHLGRVLAKIDALPEVTEVRRRTML
jgi:guanosine-3',5'-bis(diphosphate) 3'-pyrophosphohydrolase